MDYSKAFELLNQDAEKTEKAEKAVHDNLYNRGYKKGHSRGYREGINIVLDKIRAEIEQEYKAESEHPYGQGLRRALQIIDKHKAETEREE